ncbi:TPA: hypothetical protein QFM54_001861 [Enterococcus faecium]
MKEKIKKPKMKFSLDKESLFKRNKKEQKTEKGERGFTYSFGYQETDGYLFVGQKEVISVFDILIQYGTHNPANLGWLLDLIPREQLESGRVIFIQRQKGMEKEREIEIVEKDIETNITTIGNSGNEGSAKQKTQNRQRIIDMTLAGELSGMEDTIVDSDIRLVIKAKTPETVEKVVEELKTAYKHYNVKGVILVRRTGIQLKEMENLFTEVSSDAWHSSDMTSVGAGRLFLPSSGFSDETGTFIGTDRSALLANNPSIIDFTGINNAVVFMGGVSAYGSIAGVEGGAYFYNGGSAVAHTISEGNYLSGKRTHHIMLSQFNYRAPDSLIFDMSKESINTFEVFGTPETVQSDATANFNKATAVMLLLANTVSKEMYAKLETELKSLLVEWFINTANNSGMYTKDPENEPNRARRILATDNHEDYPTPYDFLPALKSNIARRATEGERARETASFLYESLSTAFNEYPNIFHKATTLPNIYTEKDRNIYYDLSGLVENEKVTGAVFLNVLAYVTNRALSGEQIIIHGLDYVDIAQEYLLPYKDKITRKNIGLITVFEKSENKVNPKNYSSFVGRLARQDMVVLGGLTEEELRYINELWRRELPAPVAQYLLQANNGDLYFYRKRDRIGALVSTHLIL